MQKQAPFLDLRSFVNFLDHSGRLKRVRQEVDKDWQIACISRWALESMREDNAYALIFDKVKNHTDPVVVNLYFSYDVYASALGIKADGLLEHWAGALSRTRKSVLTQHAPAQEVVRTGGRCDLLEIPAPVWTPGQDAGPYLSAANVITKDPDTGIQNVGNYRIQIHDSRRAGLFFGTEAQHGAIHYAKYRKRIQPMPVAIVVGAPPVVNFAAAAKTAYGIDELEVAGGLAGTSLEVVACKTVDLLVPACAELVIEGWVTPTSKLPEGPFGEAMGYMNAAVPAPVVNVSAICQRILPLHHGYVQQLPPSEGHLVMEIGALGPLWYYLTRQLRLPGLHDLAIARGSAGLAVLLVQTKNCRNRNVKAIANTLAKINFGQKFIYLFDEDIDIRDGEAVNWALSSRVDPERDIQFIGDTKVFQYDPSTLARAQNENPSGPPYASSLAIVDATLKCPIPAISLPEKSRMLSVLENWDETGLPPIIPRQRICRLLSTYPEHRVELSTASCPRAD